jgi:NADH-quinone oxidoreductase subunit A
MLKSPCLAGNYIELMLPTALVAYLVLFILVGVLFLFVSLLIGRFIRPYAPSVQKGETYECGESAVGSSFIQFDLRFYVVALLFIVFEVELAFFFPPAVVFGKLNQLRNPNFQLYAQPKSSDVSLKLMPAAQAKFGEMGVPAKGVEENLSQEGIFAEGKLKSDLQSLSLMAMLDLGVFFIVLLVGFAYLWKQGDLNWVRAIARPPTPEGGKIALQRYGEGQ